MIPVTQTKVVVRDSKGKMVVRGNCYAACIASIMQLPIEEVPNVEIFFYMDDYYWNEVMLTFINWKGWELCTDDRFKCFHQEFEDMNFGGKDHFEWIKEELKNKYYLVSGNSPRGVRHICIYQDGKMVHDPHPTKEGLITIDVFQTLEKKLIA